MARLTTKQKQKHQADRLNDYKLGYSTGKEQGIIQGKHEAAAYQPALDANQRREAQHAMRDMAIAMTKMAYNLMMITNGGKPFNGN